MQDYVSLSGYGLWREAAGLPRGQGWAGETGRRPILQRLRGRLVEWMQRTEDPLLNHWMRDQLRGALKG